MAQYLIIDRASNRLELAPGVDLDRLREQLDDADRQDGTVGVPCVATESPLRTCIVMVRPANAIRWALA